MDPVRIHKDTFSRGTPDRPQYYYRVAYGSMPATELWLKSKTDSAAIAELIERFPELKEAGAVIVTD